MLQLSRLQFSEYRKNKELYSYGFLDFKNDLTKTKKKEGKITVHIPNDLNTTYSWMIKQYFGKFFFKPHSKEFHNKFSDFKNSILSLLRRYGVLYIGVRLETGQHHKNKQITELWGYRMVLVDQQVVLENLSSEFVYNNSILKNNLPDYHTVYCGPDAKIFGWEKV